MPRQVVIRANQATLLSQRCASCGGKCIGIIEGCRVDADRPRRADRHLQNHVAAAAAAELPLGECRRVDRSPGGLAIQAKLVRREHGPRNDRRAGVSLAHAAMTIAAFKLRRGNAEPQRAAQAATFFARHTFRMPTAKLCARGASPQRRRGHNSDRTRVAAALGPLLHAPRAASASRRRSPPAAPRSARGSQD